MVDAHGPQRLWLCAGLAEDTNREGGAALLPPARQCAFLDLRGGPCRIARGTCARAGRLAHRADHLARSVGRSEEHTSELQSLMRISYAVFCLKKKTQYKIKSDHI